MTNLSKRISGFEREVLARLPGYAAADGYFYIAQSSHLISGFCVERSASRDGIYLWLLIYPLFHPSPGMSLLYSDRLAGDDSYISTENKSDEELAIEFVSIIKKHLAIPEQCQNVQGFIEHLSSSPDLLRNVNSHIGLGFALVLSGKPAQAIACLEPIAGSIPSPQRESVQRVLHLLHANPALAPAFIEKLEGDKRRAIGLPVLEPCRKL